MCCGALFGKVSRVGWSLSRARQRQQAKCTGAPTGVERMHEAGRADHGRCSRALVDLTRSTGSGGDGDVTGQRGR
jgi:hypothetical protein